jgi:hypothetical protein
MTTTNIPRYMVMTSSARMPSFCWGRYGNVAVVETVPGQGWPKMISTHARAVKRIISYEGRLHEGKPHGRSAFWVAVRRAEALVARLEADAIWRE